MTLNDCKKSKILSDLKGIYQNNQRRQAIFFFYTTFPSSILFIPSSTILIFFLLLLNFFYSNLILEFPLPPSQLCSFPSSFFYSLLLLLQFTILLFSLLIFFIFLPLLILLYVFSIHDHVDPTSTLKRKMNCLSRTSSKEMKRFEFNITYYSFKIFPRV